MNPWNIIGWAILVFGAGYALRWIWRGIVDRLDHAREVRRNLDIEPAPEQRWKISGEDIEIVKVDDDGIRWIDRYRTTTGGVMSRDHWRAAIMGGMRFVR